MPDIDCRVAKLEQRIESLIKELNEDKADNKESLERIEHNLNSVLEKIAKYQGFAGGIMFVVGGVYTVATYFLNNKS